jgi:hypothetical protein
MRATLPLYLALALASGLGCGGSVGKKMEGPGGLIDGAAEAGPEVATVPDAAPPEAASPDLASAEASPEASAEAPPPDAPLADAPADGTDARPDAPETAGDGGDASTEAGTDAASCPGTGTGECVCDGFVMPNPAASGAPHPQAYDTSAADVIVDKVTGLEWQKHTTATAFKQPAAIAFCQTQLTGGHGGWRLPTAVELVSLIDFTKKPMGTNDAFAFDALTRLWSSTLAGNPSTGMGVGFDDYPLTFLVNIVDSFPVRCVRTGGAPPPRCYRRGGRYEPQSDGVALDLATGLTWQRATAAAQMDWDAAKQFCATAPGAWRLPTLNELQTIVDHTVTSPSIDAGAFPNTPMTHDHPEIPITSNAETSPFWTSSPFIGKPFDGEPDPSLPRAWIVDFVNGYSTSGVRTTKRNVRCVR